LKVRVLRVVRELGGSTLAVVLVGGVTGRLLEELLDAAGVPRRSVAVGGLTRISQVMHERSSGLEYRFVPEGPMVQEGDCVAALAALAEEQGSWLVLSGSLPRGIGPGYYARAARQARERGQRVALDTSGAALRAALEERGVVELVKPSLGEFEALVGRPLGEAGALEAAATSYAQSGAARMVAVTLGHRGALLATVEGRCWRLPAPDVPVRGASGAGDSFVGAMVLALARGATPEDAFIWGSAAGGATVAAAGTAHAARTEVETIHAALRPHLSGG
jgi:6-phosphofructokinase 2